MRLKPLHCSAVSFLLCYKSAADTIVCQLRFFFYLFFFIFTTNGNLAFRTV